MASWIKAPLSQDLFWKPRRLQDHNQSVLKTIHQYVQWPLIFLFSCWYSVCSLLSSILSAMCQCEIHSVCHAVFYPFLILMHPFSQVSFMTVVVAFCMLVILLSWFAVLNCFAVHYLFVLIIYCNVATSANNANEINCHFGTALNCFLHCDLSCLIDNRKQIWRGTQNLCQRGCRKQCPQSTRKSC